MNTVCVWSRWVLDSLFARGWCDLNKHYALSDASTEIRYQAYTNVSTSCHTYSRVCKISWLQYGPDKQQTPIKGNAWNLSVTPSVKNVERTVPTPQISRRSEGGILDRRDVFDLMHGWSRMTIDLGTPTIRDGAPLLLLIETPPTIGRSFYVVSIYYIKTFC